MSAESERRYRIGTHPGAVRALAYLNQGEFGSYNAAIWVPGIDISKTLADRSAFGFGLNAEQEITKNIGMFSRLGWNEGLNEAWMFSDANRSGSLGVSIKGERWHRSGDAAGLAGVVSGISRANQNYLEAGGSGILDGFADPAFNRARGPVQECIWSISS